MSWLSLLFILEFWVLNLDLDSWGLEPWILILDSKISSWVLNSSWFLSWTLELFLIHLSFVQQSRKRIFIMVIINIHFILSISFLLCCFSCLCYLYFFGTDLFLSYLSYNLLYLLFFHFIFFFHPKIYFFSLYLFFLYITEQLN